MRVVRARFVKAAPLNTKDEGALTKQLAALPSGSKVSFKRKSGNVETFLKEGKDKWWKLSNGRPIKMGQGAYDDEDMAFKIVSLKAHDVSVHSSATVSADMKADIERWLKELRTHIEKITLEKDPAKAFMQRTIGWTKGPKFYRVYIESKDGGGNDRSAYCFIDMEGNIYKADSWKRPAKGIRGNVKTTDPRKADQYTSWLYRR